MKRTLIFLCRGAIALPTLSLFACQLVQPRAATSPSPLPAAQSAPMVNPSPTPIPTATATIPGDPYQKGLDKASSATTLGQNAQIPQDWDLVADQWRRAIEFMQAVPRSHRSYSAAQQLLPTYRQNAALAQQRFRLGVGTLPAAVTAKTEAGGIPLIATTEAKVDPATIVANLNQQQTDFWGQQKRFAKNLSELSPEVVSSTSTYSYSTRAEQGKAISVAIAKQKELPSYTGVVFVIKEGTEEQPISAVCMKSQPGQTAALPRLVGKDIQCPPGSTKM